MPKTKKRVYVDRLLDTNAANNQDTCDEIEKALQKLNKSKFVCDVYRAILNAIDTKKVMQMKTFLS